MNIAKENTTEKIVDDAASPNSRSEQFSHSIAAVFEALAAASTVAHVTYQTVKIDGLDIFYREAGSTANPTILLLHGFPASSQMFRNLIPKLAESYHLIAPDYNCLNISKET